MRLLAPLGIRTVQDHDGAVYPVDSTGHVEVPDVMFVELLAAGYGLGREIPPLNGDRGPQGERGERGFDAIGQEGPQGPQGDIGPMPKHQWRGTELRFEMEPGLWGKYTDLQGPPGETRVVGGGGGPIIVNQPTTGTGDGSVPYFVPAGQKFSVPIYRQALFERTIDCEGLIELDGDLIMVT